MLVTMHADSKAYNSARGLEEVVEKELIFEVVTDDVANKVPAGCWEEYMDWDEEKTPTLCHLFDKKKQISTNFLMAIFGELASILRNGDNSVSYYHRNGQKGLAVIIPVEKSQESFLEQA